MAKLMLWDAYKKYTYYVVNWKVNVLVLEKWGTNKLIVIESEELGTCTTLNRIIKRDLIEKMTTGGEGNLKDSVV